MRFMVMIKANARTEAGEMPSEAVLAAMGQYNEALVDAGVLLGGEGLHPSARGARVSFREGNSVVTDGPFAETRELIAGFWLFRTASLEDAIAWVKRCPPEAVGESDIEIRPIFEAEDFGDALTAELREQEDHLRERIAHV